jgi:hypothetical protein
VGAVCKKHPDHGGEDRRKTKESFLIQAGWDDEALLMISNPEIDPRRSRRQFTMTPEV